MAINGTMELIQTVTVPSGGQAAIEFINISQAYDDLVIKLSARPTTGGVTQARIQFNSSGGTAYSDRTLEGNGSTASSFPRSSQAFIWATAADPATASTFSNTEFYIANYKSSTSKSVSIDSVTEANQTAAYQLLVAGLWSSTSPITAINLTLNATNFAQHSTAYLYGITRIPRGAKATGGVITDTDTHWIHTFTSSGVFTPLQNLTVDYLVVAGGGSGSNGGGGAGGYRCSVTGENSGGGGSAESALSLLANTNYTATIGAGAAAVSWADSGLKGSDSTFSTITSTGGGGGGGPNVGSPLAQMNGGSGGGGGAVGGSTPVAQGGTGTTNQGYAGGAGSNNTGSNQSAGGGGGGAGSLGQNAPGGNGGSGVSSSITGTAVARAGGGGAGNSAGVGVAGGGTGGSGTGGNGTNGTAGTGGGGGGSIFGVHGQGGSGIVIVRYAK